MQRLLHTSLTSAILIGFYILSRLSPNPTGSGTHQALGLPPCLFKTITGIPCPSCGLTTSFVHLLHGHLAAAWHVNATGPLLFCCLILLVIGGFYGIVRPFHWGIIVGTTWFHHGILCGIGVLFGAWLWRLFTLVMSHAVS